MRSPSRGSKAPSRGKTRAARIARIDAEKRTNYDNIQIKWEKLENS
jgi:hypothetical protein